MLQIYKYFFTKLYRRDGACPRPFGWQSKTVSHKGWPYIVL